MNLMVSACTTERTHRTPHRESIPSALSDVNAYIFALVGGYFRGTSAPFAVGVNPKSRSSSPQKRLSSTIAETGVVGPSRNSQKRLLRLLSKLEVDSGLVGRDSAQPSVAYTTAAAGNTASGNQTASVTAAFAATGAGDTRPSLRKLVSSDGTTLKLIADERDGKWPDGVHAFFHFGAHFKAPSPACVFHL